MALMPMRAFSTARAAEITALRRIDSAISQIGQIKTQIAKTGEVSPHLDEFIAARSAGKLVLKTYLSSADGYRRHIARSSSFLPISGSASSDMRFSYCKKDH
jgi:hypothetical protein